MRIHKVLPFLLALAALPAEATTLYTSQATLLAAPGLNFTNISLSGLIGANATTIGPVNGVSFSAVSSNALQVAASPSGWPAGGIVKNAALGERTGVTLPASIVAFGAYFGQQGSLGPWSMTLTYSGGTQIFTPTALNTPSYIGLVFEAPVSDFSISFTDVSSLNKNIAISNMSIAETPEASTFVLVGVGLILFPLLKRRARGVEPSLQC